MWSKKFDENYSDVFSLKNKISEYISSKLFLKIKENNFAPDFTEFKQK